MANHRRRLLKWGGASTAAALLPRPAFALDYPTRPVHIVVGFPPGGVADILARLIGEALSARMGQPFIVDNRAGAGSNIGAENVVRAPPDGYSLFLINVTNAINQSLYKNLRFDIAKDFAPVAPLFAGPLIMEVNPTFPARTVPEFIAYAKANPGKINMALAGVGSGTHIAGELFKQLAGIDIVNVPYDGSPKALIDLLGGQVQVFFDNAASSSDLIRSGQLRALAITEAHRMDTMPDVPTIKEFLPEFDYAGWQGIAAPRNTPIDIIDKLNKEINVVLAEPSIIAQFARFGGRAFASTPAEFQQFIVEQVATTGKVIANARIPLLD